MLKHNSYFDRKVQSVGFERLGRAHSVGVVEPGEYRFDTAAAERMTIVSGAFLVKRAGEQGFQLYSAGTYFEVAANSAFDVKTEGPTAYLCEYL